MTRPVDSAQTNSKRYRIPFLFDIIISPHYKRFRILNLFDVVIVASPYLVRAFAEHVDIARPDRGVLPAPFSWFVKATQFFMPTSSGGQYAVAFTTTDCDAQKHRRWRVYDHLAKGFTESQVLALRRIVQSDIPREEAAKLVTKIVGPTVLGESGCIVSIPDDIIELMDAFNLYYIYYPWRYWRAWKARETIVEWIRETCPEEEFPVDVLHDLVTVYHGFTPGLLALRSVDRSLDKHMANNPVLPLSVRVPLMDTCLDGLVQDKLVRGKTVIIMNNGAAATECGSLDYVFGMGSERRQCPFRGVFMETGEKILKGTKGELVQMHSSPVIDTR